MTIINTTPDRIIQLGYEGEDRVTVLRFRYGKDWLENGEGVFHIRVRRHGEHTAYNAQLVMDDRENTTLLMTVTDVELSVKGSGEMQVVYSGENFVKKSPIYSYNVSRAVDEAVDPPAQDVYTQIIESLSDLQTDIQQIDGDVADLSELTTAKIGDLTELTTTAKIDLVSAINEINEHGGTDITVDDALSATSTNPVQNKVLTARINSLDSDVGTLRTSVQSKADIQTVSALSDAVNGLDGDIQGLQTTVQSKADTSTVTALSGTVSGLQTAVQSKADAQTVTTLSGAVTDLQTGKADKSYVDTQLAEKASAQTVSDLADDVGDLQTELAEKVEIPHTDEAKIAIQKMLGIYEAPWELINEETFTNETEADYVITTDSNGNAFELSDIRIIFWLTDQNTLASKGDSGRISFFDKNYSTAYAYAYLGAWTQQPNAASRGGWAEVIKDGNMVNIQYTSNLTDAHITNTFQSTYRRANEWNRFILFSVPRYCSKIIITKVTGTGHYRLYGKRKWT